MGIMQVARLLPRPVEVEEVNHRQLHQILEVEEEDKDNPHPVAVTTTNKDPHPKLVVAKAPDLRPLPQRLQLPLWPVAQCRVPI